MTESNGRIELVDIIAYRRGRDQFPEEQLDAYWGKQVAFSADGLRIVASGDDHEQLHHRLVELGIDPAAVVFEFVPDPNVSYVGWGLDMWYDELPDDDVGDAQKGTP